MSDSDIISQDKKLFPFLYASNPNSGILQKFDNYTAGKDDYLKYKKEKDEKEEREVTQKHKQNLREKLRSKINNKKKLREPKKKDKTKKDKSEKDKSEKDK
jgi:hypothetical protein